MQSSKVICDHCNEDISVTGPKPQYRIVVYSEPVPSNSEIRFAVMVYPQFKGAHHFCGKKCLKDFLTDE